MNDEWSQVAANAVAHAAHMAQQEVTFSAAQHARPSVLYRPRLFPDGNMWCALLGENLHDGVAGFGETPAKAMEAFDTAFYHERTPAAVIASKREG